MEIKNKFFDIMNSSSQRIKTGIMLIIAIIIIGLLDSFILIWLLFGGLMVVGIYEAMQLYDMDDNTIYIYASITWLLASIYPKPEDLIFIIAIIFASILAYTKDLNKQLFLPLIYPIASFLFLLSLYVSFGVSSLFWLLIIVSSTDIGAYFVGRSVGQTTFCQTSPNKTLEGVAGGMLIASILGLIFAPSFVGFFTSFFIAVLVSLGSIFGDLFESYLKREANVKDSGNILPGHGGILDRTDGYLFGGIVMLVLLRLFT